MSDPQILMEILKFRFSLHMLKDDWPPQYYWRFLKFRFSFAYGLKDDLPPTLSQKISTGNF